MNETILITGASGYIGGCTVLRLSDLGYNVIGLDKKEPSNIIKSACKDFYICDFEEISNMNILNSVDTIIHCAALIQVGESVQKPSDYYENNYVKTKKLLDYLIESELHKSIRVIISSTAAIYGEPITVPCVETDYPLPINPYGESKLMLEMTLKAYHQAYGLDYVIFRYFNAAGADRLGRHGQSSGATHIIARLLESIINNTTFTLNGVNYPTKNGTCIRDYVHVEDIVDSHMLAIDRYIPVGIYNLGSNIGTSNKEIIDTVIKVTGHNPTIVIGSSRAGDSSELTASADKWNKISGWSPQRNLIDIVTDAWKWYQK